MTMAMVHGRLADKQQAQSMRCVNHNGHAPANSMCAVSCLKDFFTDLIFVLCQSTRENRSLKNFRLYGNIVKYTCIRLLFFVSSYFQVLIAFGCGSCVLYDMKHNSSQAVKEGRNDPHKRFFYDPGHSHVS